MIKLCLSVCLLVCLSPINVKTAEPEVLSFFFVGPHMTPRKVYEWLELNKFASKSFQFLKSAKKDH